MEDKFPLNPQPKAKHKRNKEKKAARGKFSKDTIKQIFEYDEHRCAYCRSYYIEDIPHHLTLKSQGGLGIFENGAAVCGTCHKWAHGTSKGVNGEPSSEGKVWFEDYRLRKIKQMEADQ